MIAGVVPYMLLCWGGGRGVAKTIFYKTLLARKLSNLKMAAIGRNTQFLHC